MLFNQDRAMAKMDEYGVDAIVVATPRNFFYVSELEASVLQWGFMENLGAVVVPRAPAASPTLVIPEGLIGALLATPTWIPAIRPTEFLNTSIIDHVPEPVRLDPLQARVEALYASKVVAGVVDDTIVGVADVLEDVGLAGARVAFDDLRLAAHVQRRHPALQVVDAIDLMIDIRKVKTPEEIERLRTGVSINQQAIEAAIPHIEPGRVWGEAARAYRDSVQSHPGAAVLVPERSLQFGSQFEGAYYPDVLVEYESPWRIPKNRPIIFESWGTFRQYAFDFSRTAFVGSPPPAYTDICDTVLGIWHEAIETKLRPGVSTGDLFAGAAKLVAESGIPTPGKTLTFFHSIGLDIIEQPNGYPSLGKVKSWDLEENVVMNCELLYFGHSVAPYHIESTFLVTADGAEVLQTMPEALQILG